MSNQLNIFSDPLFSTSLLTLSSCSVHLHADPGAAHHRLLLDLRSVLQLALAPAHQDQV